jgi:hypothetical protein
MIDIGSAFVNKNGSWPNWLAKNVTAPGAGDGTEFIAAMVNMFWGVDQALLAYANMTPNGVAEAAGANPTTAPTSQILTALYKGLAVGPGIGVIYWKNGTPAANGDRVLLLQGQTILIASYPLLVAACYVGDGSNPSAPAFYKTSDAGGTTRSTSGAYFVLPNAQAVSLKGTGNQTINARVKSGPAFGAVEEDQKQGSTIQAQGASTVGATAYGWFLGNAGGGPVTATSPTWVTDGTNGTPRIGLATRDNTLGTNFGITY